MAGRSAAPPAGTDWHGPWSGPGGSGWQRPRQGRPRGGFAALATLLAALASWLLVYDVLQGGLQFSWPAQAGLLIAIFTVIRGLLRRIFRGVRRR